MHKKSIDLVVIGLNSIATLKKIYTNEYVYLLKKHFQSFIYIDSGSLDESQNFMQDKGFKVFELKSPDCNAALGRHLGTLKSQSDYVCFLDSDMELNNYTAIADILLSVQLDKNIVGFVGDVIDIYSNGRQRLRARKSGKYAISFGGFIIFDRRVLLDIGNWNIKLNANEELELYVRLKSEGKKVLYKPEVSVNHYTVVESPVMELISVYLPIRKYRYGALGHVVKSLSSKKKIISFCELQPEIILFFILCMTLFFASINIVLLLYVLFAFFISIRRSWKYNFVVPGLLLNIFVGVLQKKPETVVSYEEK